MYKKGLYLLLFFIFMNHSVESAELLISEVYYDPPIPEADYEFIELYNPNTFTINLSNYKLADGTQTSSVEGIYQFPTGTVLPALSTLVIAQKGTGSYALFSKYPDFEFNDTSPDIPDMIKIGGEIQLANLGDEVILSDAAGAAIDIVVWGTQTYKGVIPHPGVLVEGQSLQRTPIGSDTDNCSSDFVVGTPTPTTLRYIIVSPTAGTIGTPVTVSGKGFFATEEINIDFGTTPTINTTTTTSDGSFLTTFTITSQSAYGTMTLSATGKTSQAKVTSVFNLLSIPQIEFLKEVSGPATATPGATLTYTLKFKNIGLGTATNLILTDRVPEGTIYLTNSAQGSNTNIFYSHDGGLTYDDSQNEPVTHIRWQLTTNLEPENSGSVSFQVEIE